MRLDKLKKQAHEALKAGEIESSWMPISDGLNMAWEDAELLYMAGVFFRHKGHVALAAHLFRRCVALDHNQANPWLHFGSCLHDLHHYDEAIQAFKVAQGLAPNDASPLGCSAASHVQKGNFMDALNLAEKAIAMSPDYKVPHIAKAIACLGLGRWKEGFEEYRYMYGEQIKIRVYRQPEEPEWDGTPGKTVVVQSDQGIGDEIRFSSIIPDMIKDCKKVIIDCHPKLENLFRRSFPEADVYGTKKKKEGVDWLENYEIDAHIHISGIGRYYRKRDQDFPGKPFLTVDPVKKAKWKELLKDLPRPLVGLAWQGGIIGTGREHRSLTPEHFADLAKTGGSFIDLSYHDSAQEVAKAEKSGFKVHRFDVDQNDYDDTVALVSELDLVICVPTAIFHAAGAIGKMAWVVVPEFRNWEFGPKGKHDMVWYDKVLTMEYAEVEPLYKEFYENLHRSGHETTTGVHGSSKLDHLAGIENTANLATGT